MSTDTRWVYGIHCSWNGPIQNIGLRPGVRSDWKLPCCPHCRNGLFEIERKLWQEQITKHEEKTNDSKYGAFMEWLSVRGTCSRLKTEADFTTLRKEFDSLS